MINFEELRIKNGEPLDREKWNGLLDWVAENPLNLTSGTLGLKHFESAVEVRVEAQRDFGLLETPNAKPLVINQGKGRVGVGTADPGGALHIVGTNQDANGDTLVLGPRNQSHLRLGYHGSYSWIQSHGSLPLAINPVASNVGVGNTNPGRKLEVTGDIVTRTSSATGPACIVTVSPQGVGSLWTNNAYNPAATGSGWMRAITMKDKRVGIGEEPNPLFPLSLGAALARTKLAIYQAADGSSHYGMGVTAGHFYFNIGNPQARFVFLNSAQADAREALVIDGAGDLHFRNQIKVSDRNVKQDIRPFREGLEIVEHMSPVAYRYNGLADTVEGPEDIGLIAQELQTIAPYLVSGTRRKLRQADAEETEVLSIKPMTIVYVLVNAVKDLSRQVQALQNQLGLRAFERTEAAPPLNAAAPQP
jgi:hypothetical protein